MANAIRAKKSTLASFYMYAVFLVCYLPISCVVFAKTKGEIVLFSHISHWLGLCIDTYTYKIPDKSASILTNQILHLSSNRLKLSLWSNTFYKMIETTMRWNRIWKALRFLQITAEHQDCPVIIVFLTIKSPSQNDQNTPLTHSQILLKLNGHRS